MMSQKIKDLVKTQVTNLLKGLSKKDIGDIFFKTRAGELPTYLLIKELTVANEQKTTLEEFYNYVHEFKNQLTSLGLRAMFHSRKSKEGESK